MIEFTIADKPFGLYSGNFDIISDWINKAILEENKEPGEINIINCSDDYLLDVNLEHLNHNFYTDVITFDYVVGNIISGDIFISEERIIDNAIELKIKPEIEFLRVIIHGVMHLCGYNDHTESDKREMTNKEDYYLKQIEHVTKL
jgi:rRNA maturation RNase YbeY